MTAPISLGRLLRHRLILSATLVAFLTVGCSSDQTEHRPGGPSGKRPPFAPLAGQEVFFNGQITAELTVGQGPGFERKPASEDEPAGSEHQRHGGGGFHMGGGGGGAHSGGQGGYGGSRHGGEGTPMDEASGISSQVERQQLAAMRHAANANPPVMIHLRFTNNGTTQAELLIADFLSPLGNFVVDPEKLILAPGQTLEEEPMTSRLAGEISGTTVTLALRLAGQGEKKNIALSIAPHGAPELPPR